MFLSTRGGTNQTEYCISDVGEVSIDGLNPSVVACGEQRRMTLFSPGGFTWVPRRGQSVLVVKTGSMGEDPCVVGTIPEEIGQLQPGEICLYSDGASICLKNDGGIAINGNVTINGEALSSCILE